MAAAGAARVWAIALVVLASACGKPGTPSRPAAPAPASDVTELLHTAPPSPTPEPIASRASLPDTFPRVLIPAGAEVAAIGATASKTIVVARVPRRVSFFWPHFEWRLQDAGWTMRTYTAPGFMPTTSSVRPYTTFCRGTEFATLTYRATAEGDRLVRIAVGPEPDRSCAPMTGPMSDVPLPRFELPASVKSRPAGASAGGTLSSRVRLETSMTVTALAEHCLPQMLATGWTIEGGWTDERSMSVTRFGARSRAGDPVTGLLVFTRLESDTAVLAMLHVVRDRASGPTPPRGGLIAAEAPPTLDVTTEAQAIIRAGLTRDESAGLEIHQTLPDAFPRELLFPGSEIAAVATATSTTVVVSRIPAGARFDPTRFSWTFEDRGWTVMPGMRFGFYGPAPSQPTICRNGAFASWTYRTLANGDRLARASVTTAPQRLACAPPPTRSLGDVALPLLELPAEARLSGGGGSSGATNDAAAQARFYTTLAPETMLTACIPQMTAAGWTLETRSSGPVGTTIGRFITKSRGGQPVTALIGFATLGPYVDALLVVSKSPADTAGGR